MRFYSRVPILLLVVGLLASLWTAGRRVAVESAARTVELAVDLDQLRSQALSVGEPLGEALESLKRTGVTSVAVVEQPLLELETDGLIQVRQGGRGIPPGLTVVRIHDPALYAQVADSIRLRIPSAQSDTGIATPKPRIQNTESILRRVRLVGPRSEALIVPAGWSAVRALPIGLASDDVDRARAHGLRIVARINNFPAADDAAIAAVARRLREAGAHTVVFAGDEILGHRSRLKQTAAALDAQGLRYGSVEFGKQLGDEGLSRALQARIVRVHSVQTVEMARLGPAAVVDRFVKAAEERNIRLLYLRLFPEEPFQENLAYVAGVAQRLRDSGLRPGTADPFHRVYPELQTSPAALLEPPTPEAGRGSLPGRLLARLMPALSSLAVAGGAVLLLAGLVRTPHGLQALLALLGGAAASLAVLVAGDLGRKLVALAGAMLFPVLAFVWVPLAAEGGSQMALDATERERQNGSGVSSPQARRRAVSRRRRPAWALVQFLAIGAISLMGGLTVVGLLSERPFMMKVSAFMGIKAAHFLPLLAIAGLYVVGALGGPRPWPELRRRAQQNLATFLVGRLQVWHLAAGFLGLVVLGMMLARTGNDPGVGISGTEMTLRSLLDRYLVRPRTKEFLIGHPVLLTALVLSARGTRSVWLAPLALVGAIGQVSMVNSFCHLHTPLLLTLARTFNGLWIGALAGAVLVWLVGRWIRPRPEALSPPLASAPSPALHRSSVPSSR